MSSFPGAHKHQPPLLSLGSMCPLSWQLHTYLPSDPSSPFYANHSQVKSKLSGSMATFSINFRPFLTPIPTPISFLPFRYINCILEEVYVLVTDFSLVLCT